MIKEFEMLDVFPTLTDEELLEVNGGMCCTEGGSGSGMGSGWKFW